jgi:hypothetical protein
MQSYVLVLTFFLIALCEATLKWMLKNFPARRTARFKPIRERRIRRVG